MKKREERIEERKQSAVSLRSKGNKLFKEKKYEEALTRYCEALEKTPYAISVLTNLALVNAKLDKWEKSIEYCNRAVHVDKTCTKALYLRHKSLLHLNNEQKALDDLNRCVTIDDKNELFFQAQQKLSLKLQNDSIQLEVQSIVNDKNKSVPTSLPIDASSTFNIHGLSIEHIYFTVTSKKGDSEHTLMVKEQCQYVDKCMDVFKTYGLSYKAFNAFPTLSTEPNLTICNMFVAYKLCKCPIACAYMRTSGHMSQILQRLECYCQSYKDGTPNDKDETKKDVIEIVNMLTELMKYDVPTGSFMVDVSTK